jgi:hypothetical protein
MSPDIAESPRARVRSPPVNHTYGLSGDARGGDGGVRQELVQKPSTAMRARHRGRPRQIMPLEHTGAFTLACVAILLVVALAIVFLS